MIQSLKKSGRRKVTPQGITFLINSLLLGVGLAADAFSVSLADGLGEPEMKKAKFFGIPFTFALFQALMPLTGWFLVHTAVERFESFSKAVPWIAFVLLAFLGGKMIFEASKAPKDGEKEAVRLGIGALIMQGIATSIDALSVGFAISDYDAPHALICAAIIAAVTFILCVAGILIGRKAGTKLSGKAQILGGAILVAIGLEILLSGIL
ncbi:MAG: manganese efflux pump [Clostridia bacterium]|nr:manganese efflux pump [Clostridia bacterium]